MPFRRLLNLLSLFALIVGSAHAESGKGAANNKYTLSTSLWTQHFNPQPGQNNNQNYIGLERRGQNMLSIPLDARFPALENATPLLGFAFFNNSYYQSSVYAYAGYDYDIWQGDNSALYIKLTAGFIHGYRDEYQHKVPLNDYGTSPAAIPSFGFRYKQIDSELVIFGVSGLMLLIGYNF
ncbi:sn-glycerol-3-phosphate transporter [Aliidiomarina sedimenti]|uniref:Sn-glycerol-3-phosphate transporter n=1 Tax=Aliidiomarina sedimenti TaxID=1933879 RepID=A0ABY0BWS4_9GAMM|nr:sn-glycerol-3-phosphate transporter [Aliidiomarina sedimenti]RUO28834.1 sn-glycerol-3-phosphate transporter [Aliidiomarina sedimenti]